MIDVIMMWVCRLVCVAFFTFAIVLVVGAAVSAWYDD